MKSSLIIAEKIALEEAIDVKIYEVQLKAVSRAVAELSKVQFDKAEVAYYRLRDLLLQTKVTQTALKIAIKQNKLNKNKVNTGMW